MFDILIEYVNKYYLLVIYIIIIIWLLIIQNIKIISNINQIQESFDVINSQVITGETLKNDNFKDSIGIYKQISIKVSNNKDNLYLTFMPIDNCINKQPSDYSYGLVLSQIDLPSDVYNNNNCKFHITTDDVDGYTISTNSSTIVSSFSNLYLSVTPVLSFNKLELIFEKPNVIDNSEDFRLKTSFTFENVSNTTNEYYIKKIIKSNNVIIDTYYLGKCKTSLCQAHKGNYQKICLTKDKAEALSFNLNILDENAII